MVFLSIIIPTLNEEKYLPILLESIGKQTYKDYEIIVTDSDSKDKTVAIARKFGCRVVKIHNGSPAKGRNAGAKVAKGDLLLFLDADGEFRRANELEVFIRHFLQRKIGSCSCKHYAITKNPFIKFVNIMQFLAEYLMQSTLPYACGYFIACYKWIHIKIGGYDEVLKVSEDVNYVRRAAKLGKFRILSDVEIWTSPRRIEKEGIKYIFFGVWVFIYNLFHSGFKKTNYDYEFGKF
ncbi:MAG: glycosyltransferase [archaeon]